ncbi:MAG: ribbon-helix-helix protein, CopG family [Actinobacteria bacterium]|nr:ribbon-helix-helix protein, CopG family [Actinomycetota bacterium]
MIRTQISLTEDQMGRLRRESARTGKSIAQLTREAIDRVYDDDRKERLRRFRAVAGKHRGGGDNVSENIDEEFVKAVMSRWRDDVE